MNQFARKQAAGDRWTPQLVHDVANSPDLAAAALRLGANRVPVFPCVPGGKRPLTPHGFQDATAEHDSIDSWWRRQPEANIGVPTGALGGIDVVDVDVRPTGSGYPGIGRARDAGLVDGWAWLVRTPSGGLHAYFLHDEQREQRSWQVPDKHIDFRGDGGYIVMPPSQVVDTAGVAHGYELLAVADHRQPRPVDATALRAYLDPPRTPRPPKDLPPPGARPEHLAAYVASCPEGRRNNVLFWAACRMVEDGHPWNTTAHLLGEAAQTAGLPEAEAMGAIRSAYRCTSQRGSFSAPQSIAPVEAVGL